MRQIKRGNSKKRRDKIKSLQSSNLEGSISGDESDGHHDSNLILVGGIAGYDEQSKNFMTLTRFLEIAGRSLCDQRLRHL